MKRSRLIVVLTLSSVVTLSYSGLVLSQTSAPLPAPSRGNPSDQVESNAPTITPDPQSGTTGNTAETTAPTAESPDEAASVSTRNTAGLETVVVTARRSAENSQKVPVAVTAFSAKDLEQQQIKSGQDLNGIVPSLVVNSGSTLRNSETPTIRGQGATFGASPGVVVYYGEVPLPSDFFNNQQGGPGKFFDLQNLQVLKGSQGTLFGRNTTGGALVLEPHKPDPYLEGSIKAELGNYNDKGLEAVFNAPLIDDQLMVRLGAKYYERDGFTTNVTNGQDLDDKGFRTMRLGLMWKPTSGVQNYLLGYYTHSADNGTSDVIDQFNNTAIVNGVNIGCLVVDLAALRAGLGNTHCGQTIVAAQQARGIRAIALSTAPDDILDTGGLIDSFSYDLLDQLTLRNIASYQTYKHHYRWDQDGSIIPVSDFTLPDNLDSSNFDTYTDELQVQGHAFDQSLKYVSGVYFQYLQPAGALQQNNGVEFNVLDTISTFSIKTLSFGPYAQATYNLGGLVSDLDGLNVTAGARYAMDNSWGTHTSGGYIHGLPHPSPPPFGNDPSDPAYSAVKNSAPTWTVGLDYKIPTTLLYGKVSRGYKSGGISPEAVTPSRLTYKPEFVINYEIGHKSDLWLGGMPVRVNSALYYTDYTDIQKTATDIYAGPTQGVQFGGATVNAAKASIYGFETELTVMPMRGLTLLANYSYTYAKYNDFTLAYFGLTPIEDCQTAQTGKSVTYGETMQLSCLPFNYVPRHQGSLTARYEMPVPQSVGHVNGTATYSFIDRQYSSSITIPNAEPGAWLGAYGLLNASVDWTSILGSSLDLQLFGTNLTDRTYRISNSNVWNFLYFESSIYGEPRMFGAQLSYHWGD